MSDDSSQNTSVEDRIDTVEQQLEDLDIDTIEDRLKTIETEQSHLRSDLNQFVESVREQNKETPHIDSVEALYSRLEMIEDNIGTLRQSLEEVVEDPR